MKSESIWQQIADNATFVFVVVLVMIGLALIAWGTELVLAKKGKIVLDGIHVKKIAGIGLFSALATILMLLEIPVPFAPPFYKIDLSEIPVLLAAFLFGPVAGVLTEVVKVLLNIVFNGTTTVFVGEFANFAVGCSFIIPAAFIYLTKKTRKRAILGLIVGTLVMAIFGSAFNGVYLLPKFAQLYGMDISALVAMGTTVNPAVNSVWTLVFFAVFPLNLLKGILTSVVVILIYKPISTVFHKIN